MPATLQGAGAPGAQHQTAEKSGPRLASREIVDETESEAFSGSTSVLTCTVRDTRTLSAECQTTRVGEHRNPGPNNFAILISSFSNAVRCSRGETIQLSWDSMSRESVSNAAFRSRPPTESRHSRYGPGQGVVAYETSATVQPPAARVGKLANEAS